jgi:hypothetical protein
VVVVVVVVVVVAMNKGGGGGTELDSVFRNVSTCGFNTTSKFHPRDVILLCANTSTPDTMPA